MTTKQTPLERVESSLVTFALMLPFMVGRKTVKFAATIHAYQREWLTVLQPIGAALMRGDVPATSRAMFVASKGAGKDLIIAILLLWLTAFSTRALMIQVAACDEDQAREVLKWIKLLLSWAPEWLKKRVKLQAVKLIGLKNGSEAEIIACDVAGSHGARPDLLIVNEFSHVVKWEFVETLIDNASKVANGAVLFFGNAGFKETPQYRLYQHAKAKADAGEHWIVHEYNQPAPHRDEKHLDDAAVINSPTRQARLNYGVWSSGTGDFLDDADLTAAVDAALPILSQRAAGWVFTAGYDGGFSHDHAGFVVTGKMRAAGAVQYRVAQCQSWDPRTYRDNRIEQSDIEAAILAAHRAFGLAAVYIDPTEARYLGQRLKSQGVRIVEFPFVGKNLDLLATTIVQVFKNRAIQIPNIPTLIADLRRLNIKERRDGEGMKLTAKRDASGHADRAIALALSLIAGEQRGVAPMTKWGGPIFLGGKKSEFELNHGATDHFTHLWSGGQFGRG